MIDFLIGFIPAFFIGFLIADFIKYKLEHPSIIGWWINK